MEEGVGASRKKDRFSPWLVLPILPLVVYALLPAYYEYCAAAAQRDAIRSRIVKIHELNRGLEEQLHAMETDPFYVEKVARENLGYRRPGEVFIYPGRLEKSQALAQKGEEAGTRMKAIAQRLRRHRGVVGVAALLVAATWGLQLVPTGSGGTKFHGASKLHVGGKSR